MACDAALADLRALLLRVLPKGIASWNGADWSLVPAAPGGNLPEFKSVTAVVSNDIWAVGRRQDTVSPYYLKTLIEHWDGASWTVVPSPNGSTTNSQFLAVDAGRLGCMESSMA